MRERFRPHTFVELRSDCDVGRPHQSGDAMIFMILAPIPNPVRRDAPIQDVENTATIRKLHCRLQSACLKYAAKESWQGMSCERCDVDEPMSLEDLRSDVEAMTRMWSHA